MALRGYMLVALAVMMIASTATAESLWTQGSKGLFTDHKARKVGDTVTILIVESSSSSQQASTGFNKKLDHSNSAGLGTIFGLIPPIGVSSSQAGSSSGSTSRSSNFVAQITATVTKVLPNGNMELEGVRTVETNSEKQEIKLTGTVRPQDVTPNNTVLSTYLADAEVKSTGKGPIGDRQREGLISKLIKFLF